MMISFPNSSSEKQVVTLNIYIYIYTYIYIYIYTYIEYTFYNGMSSIKGNPKTVYKVEHVLLGVFLKTEDCEWG